MGKQSSKNIRNRQARAEYIRQFKLDTGCQECGRQDLLADELEFDHIQGPKIASISQMPSHYGLDSIKAEIAKCEVVCRRCHVARTMKRRTGIDING